jgi:hypothetical protein
MVYVVESLVLALPQTVLQSVLLVQDPDSIPKIKGMLSHNNFNFKLYSTTI